MWRRRSLRRLPTDDRRAAHHGPTVSRRGVCFGRSGRTVDAVGDRFTRMNGSPKIIEFLNEALTAELTAINQYFAHAKLCESWGWTRLAEKYREESIEEMRDAEKLMERILLLDGMPNLQRLGSVRVGESVHEQLELDLDLESNAVAMYRRGVSLALEEADPGSRELLEELVVGEEEHLDWIETQLRVIADIGIERYLQSQLGN
jgi:bacterioferritin